MSKRSAPSGAVHGCRDADPSTKLWIGGKDMPMLVTALRARDTQRGLADSSLMVA